MSRTSSSTGIWYESLLGSPSVVVASDRLFTAGVMAREPASLESEAHQVFRTTAGLLHGAGASLADVMRTRLFYIDEGGEGLLRDVHGVVFDHPGPAMTLLRVDGLPRNARVAMEVEAAPGRASDIHHYEPTRSWSCSNGVALDEEALLGAVTAENLDGSVALPEQHAEQMDWIYGTAIDRLGAMGYRASDVVATRHYYAFEHRDDPSGTTKDEFMAAGQPTSAGICVRGVGGAGATFALECDAAMDAANAANRVRTGRTYEIEHHYSRSVRFHDTVYVAGTTSIVPGEIVRHPGDVRAQVFDTLETIRWAIEQQDVEWSNLVQTRSYIVGGPGALDEAASAIKEATGGLEAVATMVGVPVLGRAGVVVEIEATAVRAS